MNTFARTAGLLVFSLIGCSTRAAELKVIPTLKKLCIQRLKSRDCLEIITADDQQRAYIDSKKMGLELFSSAEALALELRVSRHLNLCGYLCCDSNRYIQEHYTEIDAIDPAKERYDGFPFEPSESFVTKPYVPFYYKKQAYATPEALYLVTGCTIPPKKDERIPIFPYRFVIYKIDPKVLKKKISWNDLAGDEQQMWHRIADTKYSIASVSLVPGVSSSDEPKILIFFKTGAAFIHSKKEEGFKPFTLPKYCTDTHHICLADDPQSGKRVMYESNKKTFWLIEKDTGFSLPIYQALYAFFFDKGTSLYVQESRSNAFCLDLSTNTKYPLAISLACDEISSDHIVRLYKSTLNESNPSKLHPYITLEHNYRGRIPVSHLITAACYMGKIPRYSAVDEESGVHSKKIPTVATTKSCILL